MPRKRAVQKVALFLVSGALLLSGCAARFARIEPAAAAPAPKPETGSAQTTKHPLNGVIFTLPKTVLTVDLQVERTRQTEGLYCQFNNLFWPGTQNAVPCTKKPTDAISTTPAPVAPTFETNLVSLAVTSRGIPDPSKRFVLPIGTKAMVDSTDSLDLTETGTVSGAESSRVDRTGEVILATLNTAAGIMGKVLAGAKLLEPQVSEDNRFIDELTKGLGAGRLKKLRENYSRLSTKEKEIYTASLPTTTPLFQEILKARQVWDDILTIDDRRSAILGGLVPAGSNASDLLKANSDLLDGLAKPNFFGVEKTTPWNPSFEIVPRATSPASWNAAGFAEEVTLFTIGIGCFDKISPHLVKNTLPPGITCKPTGPGTIGAVLKIAPAEVDQLASVIDSFYSKPSQTSYPFTIPASVKVSLTGFSNVAPPAQTAALAQWGTLNHFPVGKGAKGRTLKVTYYEATGALKSIKFGSDAPLNKSVIDSLSGSANSVLDGQLKADASAAAAAKISAAGADELAKLVRQRQILEEKDKIAKLCAAAGVSCAN